MATALRNQGHQVFWLDCIRHNWTPSMLTNFLLTQSIDRIIWEIKTPTMPETMRIGAEIKIRFPSISIENIGEPLTNGNYDRNLSGELCLIPDRFLTHWEDYAYHNGNFKHTPGTYTMFARNCWWGKCTFCAWGDNFFGIEPIQLTPTQAVLDVAYCHQALKAKEIFDDSGSFPIKDWCREFCTIMIASGMKVRLGCNVRFTNVGDYPFNLMKQAGFRFLLWGLESANQTTLDRLHKGTFLRLIEDSLESAASVGLENHLTVMVGFPWEDESAVENTCLFIRKISPHLHSLQVSLCMPYPNTTLYKEVKDYIIQSDYSKWDMSEPVLSCNHDVLQARRKIYQSVITPSFIINRIIRGGLKDAIRSLGYYLSHLREFSR